MAKVAISESDRSKLTGLVNRINQLRRTDSPARKKRPDQSGLNLSDLRIDEQWMLTRANLLLDEGWAETYPVAIGEVDDPLSPSGGRNTSNSLSEIERRRDTLWTLASLYANITGVSIIRRSTPALEQYLCAHLPAPTVDELIGVLARAGFDVEETLTRVVTPEGWVRLFLRIGRESLWLELHRRGHRWRASKVAGPFSAQLRKARRECLPKRIRDDRGVVSDHLDATEFILVGTALNRDGLAMRALSAIREHYVRLGAVVLVDGHCLTS